MITSKDEHSIRSGYPVPENPLELLIAKDEANVAFDKIAGCNSLDAETLIFLADFAAQHPNKWLTVKEKINDPGSSYNDLAVRLGISRGAVIRHLKDLRTEAKKWNGSPFVQYEHQTSNELNINEADGSAQGFKNDSN